MQHTLMSVLSSARKEYAAGASYRLQNLDAFLHQVGGGGRPRSDLAIIALRIYQPRGRCTGVICNRPAHYWHISVCFGSTAVFHIVQYGKYSLNVRKALTYITPRAQTRAKYLLSPLPPIYWKTFFSWNGIIGFDQIMRGFHYRPFRCWWMRFRAQSRT